MLRSVCLTRVALIRVALDASFIITSSRRFLHSAVSRHRQSGTVNFAGWTSCRVTKLFKVCFTDVNVEGSFVVAVIRCGLSRFNVWQLWDDQQICRNIDLVRLPRRSTEILQQFVVVSLLFWDSTHGLNNICPSLVHGNGLSCFYSNTHEHTSRPPRLQLVSSALSVVSALTKARQLNSPGLTLQTRVGCVTVVLTLVEEPEKIGTMLVQPSQQRTSRPKRDSRLLLQEVFEVLASPCTD